MNACNNRDLFSFLVSWHVLCVVRSIRTQVLVFCSVFSFCRSPYFSLAFRVVDHEQSPFVMVAKPVLYCVYLKYLFFYPFFSLCRPALSFFCNLLTLILSTLRPQCLFSVISILYHNIHINSMSMSEPLECRSLYHWFWVFVFFLFFSFHFQKKKDNNVAAVDTDLIRTGCTSLD